MNVEDRIWTLLARQCAGEATAAELQELETLLAQDAALKSAAQKIIAAWHSPGNSHMQQALTSFARVDALIQQGLHSQLERKRTPVIRLRTLLTAAACIIALLIGGWFLYFANKPAGSAALARQEVSSLPGSIRKIKLPDGSLVWLNEDSKMGYNDAFNDKTREIWLTGEAFFEVTKDKTRPFIIHTRNVNVKVLGTAFNVRSYPHDKNITTSLIRGSVEVTLNNEPGKKYLLKPDQKLVVAAQDDAHTVNSQTTPVVYAPLKKVADPQSDSLVAEVSWVDRKLAFYETTFKDLAVDLGKRYHVNFVFRSSTAEQLTFTGVFYEQTLAEALHALSLTAPFRYRIEDSTVFIAK